MTSYHSLFFQYVKTLNTLFQNRIYRALSYPAATIFLYHTIETESNPYTFGHRYVTPFSVFQRQINFIKNNFKVVSTADMIEILIGRRITNNIAAIHFDDGFSSYLDLALPCLQKQGIPSTQFLITSVIQGDMPIRNKIAFCLNMGETKYLLNALNSSVNKKHDNCMNLEQMNSELFLSWIKNNLTPEMIPLINDIYKKCMEEYKSNSPFLNEQDLKKIRTNSYVEIGSHTKSHPMLSKLSESEQIEEIIGGHRELENIIGTKLQYFAYPYGAIAHFNESSRYIVQKIEGLNCFTTYGGVNYQLDKTDIMRITLTAHEPEEIKSQVLDVFFKKL